MERKAAIILNTYWYHYQQARESGNPLLLEIAERNLLKFINEFSPTALDMAA